MADAEEDEDESVSESESNSSVSIVSDSASERISSSSSSVTGPGEEDGLRVEEEEVTEEPLGVGDDVRVSCEVGAIGELGA